MKQLYLLLFSFAFALISNAQQKNLPKVDTLIKEINLDAVVVSATNFDEKLKHLAQQIDIISAKQISLSNSQNTGDLLANTGKIFVQKSQQGGSSPVLRGFEASRILLVVDGVRMNNAIYRSGHLQNIITVDQNVLSRVEVLFGPSSAIYGSDALGGAIQFVTKKPVLSSSKNIFTTGSSFVRYSNVNNEKTMHADVSIGKRKLAWLQSINYSDFGDMRMGSNYLNAYEGFGKRTNYIDHINGSDTVLVNSDDRIQKFSGYKQWDILQKILFKQSEKVSHLLNIQISNSSNIPRYDRLQDVRNGNLRYASWYYGPQKRVLAAYELNITRVAFFDALKLNVNYQDIEESRITREYRRYDRLDARIENVKVWGATLTGKKVIGNNELTTGFDMQLNDVKSVATRTNMTSGTISKLDTRYPDGANKMNHFALFFQHVYKFSNNKLVLNDGLRLQAVQLKSNVLDNSFFSLPDTNVKQNNRAITGNVGLVFIPSNKTTLRINLSSGFRAPNIDDLAKIFESSTSAKQVVLPNSNLKPEYTYNLDAAIKQKLSNRISVEFNSFYTLFRNAIIKAPFKLNGQDSILYNGVKSQVLASQNVNNANLYGFTAGLDVTISSHLSFNTSFTYTKGEFIVDASKTSKVYEKQPNGTYTIVDRYVKKRPLDHIPPFLNRSALTFNSKKLNVELFMLYNGWKKLNQYNPDGEDNAQYATVDGTPSWTTFNLKTTYNPNKNIAIQTGIENIFDRNYRCFASGFSAAGRNIYVTLRFNW